MPMRKNLDVRVMSRLPTVARRLEINTKPIVEEAAEFTRQRWSEDVRVSPGDGNYDGRGGGSPGHYRDNIYVQQNPRAKNSFHVVTPVWYATYNEFGGPTISAKPSARRAATLGEEYFTQRLTEMIKAATVTA